MNIAILVGRITAEADVKVTNSGKKVCSFALAVDDGKNADGTRRTQFIDCVAWDKPAEFLGQYVHKGNRIAVVGKNTKRSYERDGHKVYISEVVCDRVEFADGANQSKNEYSSVPVQNAPRTAQNQPVQASMDNGFGIPSNYGIDSDDLPF